MPGTIRIKLAELLARKKERERREISLYEVARDTGIKWATIKRWSAGSTIGRFDAPVMVALLEYFSSGGPQLRIGDLLEYEPERPAKRKAKEPRPDSPGVRGTGSRKSQ